MRAADISVGDRVKVSHKGRTDTATVVAKEGRAIVIEPDHAKRFTWRVVPAKEITDIISVKWSPTMALTQN